VPIERLRSIGSLVALVAILALSAGCDRPAPPETARDEPGEERHLTSTVDTDRIADADSEPGNWMAVGRTYREQYYSPLDDIDRESVGRLGLAWTFDLDTNRGQEATPLVVDGIMYLVTAWNKVKALDARTGDLLWAFDPGVDRAVGALTCCDVVSRGLAIYQGKVFVATLDGRLLAVDAGSGEALWEVLTVEPGEGYNITGAPRAAKGKVFIGNGGADNGLRGYVSAYDVDTGELVWRFFTVPGDPTDGQEYPILERAAETWSGEYWKTGTGGTAWDAIVYDPELDQLYIGVGNGGPWDPSLRSPEGGDNLFLASIVAVEPDTGEYLWHYQQVPAEAWDYTATQPIVLADLEIEGRTRKVLMQAPKNGFFYVIDRRTGELVSAKTIVPINWAEPELDASDRPVVRPEARYWETGQAFLGSPGPAGAHNWLPMAYHPEIGLVYIPVTISPMVYAGLQTEGDASTRAGADLVDLPGFQAVDEALHDRVLAMNQGFLLAWDPVRQQEAWRVEHLTAVNGGTLATGGNLVFQGEANGELAAFDAETGEKRWAYATHGGIVAAPATYRVDGEQYVALLQGWGGGFAIASGEESRLSGPKRNISRVLAFKLGGEGTLPEPPPFPELDPPPPIGSAGQIETGRSVYASQCARCHGGNAVGATNMPPDLRASPSIYGREAFASIVHGGSRSDNGMPDFEGVLSDEVVETIRAYVIDRANAATESTPAAFSPARRPKKVQSARDIPEL
jgi:alcohol dehydrogenase (cytochrome c)/quinohemoprotein ethanol dehydrogenase